MEIILSFERFNIFHWLLFTLNFIKLNFKKNEKNVSYQL